MTKKFRMHATVALAAGVVSLSTLIACSGAEGLDESLATTAERLTFATYPTIPQAGAFSVSGKRVRAFATTSSRTYVGGDFSVTSGGVTYKNLISVKNDGTLDTAFRPNPNSPVWALALGTGVLYVGGEFTSIGNPAATRSRLAAVSYVDGSIKKLNVSVSNQINPCGLYSDPSTGNCSTGTSGAPNYAYGVHALETIPGGSGGDMLVVGGNFMTMTNSGGTAVTRRGIGVIDIGPLDITTSAKDNIGSVHSSFAGGVGNGWVAALAYNSQAGLLYIGGSFTTITASGSSAQTRYALAATNAAGTVDSHAFSGASGGISQTGSTIILDLAVDQSPHRLYAAGGGGNKLFAYVSDGTNMGTPAWQDGGVYHHGPYYDGAAQDVHGDVQAVDWAGDSVYFGFHDGLFADQDGFKIAAVDKNNGHLQNKTGTTGNCGASASDRLNCWLPGTNTGTTGFLGVWAISQNTNLDPDYLLVGGDFTRFNNASGSAVSNTGKFARF